MYTFWGDTIYMVSLSTWYLCLTFEELLASFLMSSVMSPASIVTLRSLHEVHTLRLPVPTHGHSFVHSMET